MANGEAQRFNAKDVGTEHILLALMKDGCRHWPESLQWINLDLRKIRQEVARLTESGQELMMGVLPLTSQAERAIERAVAEAQNLGHKYIGSEHLFLGLLRETEGVAAQVLVPLQIQIADVRREILGAETSA
ncbi:MAG: Clp protease N-terminal domain-containing protein [Pirellulaceae bacterium]|nr:Clp protease N-terminal domain-containing protein [Pirellulaceae bacterium]